MGMGLYAGDEPHPHPALPLKGREWRSFCRSVFDGKARPHQQKKQHQQHAKGGSRSTNVKEQQWESNMVVMCLPIRCRC